MSRLRLNIKGRVQGVGFRPFVFNLAKRLNLNGYVKNTSRGVVIEVEGERTEEFIKLLQSSPPPLSRIESIQKEVLEEAGFDEFRILSSEDEGSFTHVSPDVSICEDCRRELMDPSDRRYLYPFINCTNCGPRYSITLRLPYDRPNTTMAPFRMCSQCYEEYHNPEDRRFHAQPNACPVCGPSLRLIINSPEFANFKDLSPLEAVIRILKAGGIVAIKGLGGFHIACNAENRRAIVALRQRKGRGNKPFALMAPDIETIERYCYIEPEERRLLLSEQKPIVLLKKKNALLPEEIAPQNRFLGFMLPYTPLHYLLFYQPIDENSKNFSVLVMTSGNLSEEPIIHKDEEALQRLSHIVDAFLLHNREIFMRVDDSVVTSEFFIRRARGYVPEPVRLHIDTGEFLGVGSDLKNTFALTKEGYAIVSQHIGDMDSYKTLQFFEEVLENLSGLYRIVPEAVGADLHPDYYSRRWADKQGLQVFYFQHHYAHVASVMAEHNLTEKVIGIVFDGTGYGTDGTIWGGEFVVADLEGFQRVGHLRYIPLPGGEVSIKEPWRTGLSLLRETFGEDIQSWIERLGITKRLPMEKVFKVLKVMENTQLCPVSSGCGRLFDAVASLMGVKDINTFEAEAPMALEALVVEGISAHYPFDIIEKEHLIVDYRPLIISLIEDLIKGESLNSVATKFHNTLVEVAVEVTGKISKATALKTVVLSGGVFQNLYLLRRVVQRLKHRGYRVFYNRILPPNDACISLGQVYLLAWRYS
jgi:hydrogenase maturation protein HypF